MDHLWARLGVQPQGHRSTLGVLGCLQDPLWGPGVMAKWRWEPPTLPVSSPSISCPMTHHAGLSPAGNGAAWEPLVQTKHLHSPHGSSPGPSPQGPQHFSPKTSISCGSPGSGVGGITIDVTWAGQWLLLAQPVVSAGISVPGPRAPPCSLCTHNRRRVVAN